MDATVDVVREPEGWFLGDNWFVEIDQIAKMGGSNSLSCCSLPGGEPSRVSEKNEEFGRGAPRWNGLSPSGVFSFLSLESNVNQNVRESKKRKT